MGEYLILCTQGNGIKLLSQCAQWFTQLVHDEVFSIPPTYIENN